MKTIQRIISFILTVCLVLPMLPATGWAEEAEPEIAVEKEEMNALAEDNGLFLEEREEAMPPSEAEETAVSEAPEPKQVKSGESSTGTCGENLTWLFDDLTGTLTISGSGEMEDYTYSHYDPESYSVSGSTHPWGAYAASIVSIVITDGVTSIGERAFLGCSGVTNVVIPESVTHINDYAFEGCSALMRVAIPDSVTRIGVCGFRYCKSLENVTIGSGLSDLSYHAFEDCSSLESIVIPNGPTTLVDTFKNCTSLKNVVIPDSVTEILGAFYGCSSLTNVEIPYGVTCLEGAFRFCTNLTNVEIPNSVTDIDYAFEGCTSLTNIEIPDSISQIYMSFENCSGLVGVVIPDTVALISSSAFKGCSSLTNVEIPKHVVKIEGDAFAGDTALKEIIFKGDAPIIASFAFGNVEATAYYPDNNLTWTADVMQDYGGTITWVPYTLEEGPGETDGASGTCGEDLIWSLDAEGTLTISGTGRMTDYGYMSQPWMTYREFITHAVVADGVASIGDCAFSGCSELRTIEIPGSVTEIGYAAFIDCSSLTGISIPDGVTDIGGTAFGGCSSLTSVVLSNWLTVIPDSIFSGCTSLKEIKIPENVTQIKGYAFSGCSSLTDIVMSDRIYTIGEYAFMDCESLIIITIPNRVAIINEGMFHGCSSLTSIVIPDHVTNYARGAFDGCSSLESITIPKQMTKIHEYTFRNCSSLKSIVIHEGVTGIGNWAFDGCSSLAELVLPDSVTNVGDWAFRNCSSLTSAVIPAGVTRMAGTFEGCKSLLDVYYGGTSEQLELVKKYFPSAAYLHPSCKNPVDHWKTESVDATCTEDGYTREYCACGHEKNVIISTAAGHDMSGWHVTIPAACTEKGEQRRECSRCDYYETEEIPAHGHTEVIDEAVAATCTEAGLTEGKHCAVCKEILAEQKAVAALGHDMSGWHVTTPVSCTESGEQRRECSRCDYYEAEEIPAHGHTEVVDEAVAATCTEAGLTEGKHCAVCKEILAEQKAVAALGHDMSGWHVTISAACTEKGEQRRECSRCDYYETEEIPAHGHTEVVDETVAATCTEAGLTEGKHCAVCNKILAAQITVEALGHDMGEWTVTVPAACEEAGTQRKNCSRCSYFENEEIPATGHSYDVVVTPPTCTEDGCTTHTCHCGDSYTDAFVEKLGHTESIDEAIPPTCTENGFSEGSHCITCGEKLMDQTLIPALGHDFALAEGNITCSTCGESMSVRIHQDYILMDLQTTNQMQLPVEVSPAELTEKLQWRIEGDDNLLDITQDGTVTAMGTGTVYVVATLTCGAFEMNARCRVDVVDASGITGIQLDANKLTLELYSTDYAELEILLQLPQNYFGRKSYGGRAIVEARFVDEDTAAVFDLVAADDRHLLVVPKAEAIANPGSVQGSYESAITVRVGEQEYTTGSVKLTVKKTLPKLKAAIDSFNSFYSGQSNEIQINGATVTDIRPEGQLPDWLSLEEGFLVLTENAPQKSTNAKVSLLVDTEEWSIPAAVTLNVKNTYKTPGLKLSASTVTFASDSQNSVGVPLVLQCKNKKDVLSEMKVTGITAPEGYGVSNFDPETGTFTLKAEEGFRPGKITLEVQFADTDNTLPLKVTVKSGKINVKLAKTTVTLNAGISDSVCVPVTVTPGDYRISGYTLELLDSRQEGQLAYSYENGCIIAATTDTTEIGAAYKLRFTAAGKSVNLTVKTNDKSPEVTLKASGQVDLSFPKKAAVVTASFKNYSGKIGSYTWTVAESKGKTLIDANAAEKFQITQNGNTFELRAKEGAELDTRNTYMLTLKLTLANGLELPEKTVKLPVKNTPVKLKLSKNKLTLNKLVSDSASVTVTCTTKGYPFTAPSWEVTDSKGNAASEVLKLHYEKGTLTVDLGEGAAFGSTYKVLLKANEYASPVTLTVTVPTEAKSKVTVTLKASGTLDVIRDGSTVTVTPSYKNVTDCTQMEEQLLIYSSADKYAESVNHLFSIRRSETGAFLITKAEGAALDHTRTYKVRLVTVLGDTVTAESKQLTLKVKMGSAKLTAAAEEATLFGKDKHDRLDFSLTSRDETLNEAGLVTVKDAKYKDVFEIHSYGNGRFAIGFKDGQVDTKLLGKTVTLTLNVTLDGNESGKINTTVKLKLTVIK